MFQSILAVLLSAGTFVGFGGLGYALNYMGLNLVDDDENATTKVFIYVVFGALIFVVATGIFITVHSFFYNLLQ